MAQQPTKLDEHGFDLRGFCVLPNALSPSELASMNSWIDSLGRPLPPPGEWIGNVEVQTYYAGKPLNAMDPADLVRPKIDDGHNLQHIFEVPEFQCAIDHPSWYGLVQHYLGPSTTPSMHEMFVNVRGPGGYIAMHGGGRSGGGRAGDGVGIVNGEWRVVYMSLIIALTDIGPGDGATCILPGSVRVPNA